MKEILIEKAAAIKKLTDEMVQVAETAPPPPTPSPQQRTEWENQIKELQGIIATRDELISSQAAELQKQIALVAEKDKIIAQLQKKLEHVPPGQAKKE